MQSPVVTYTPPKIVFKYGDYELDGEKLIRCAIKNRDSYIKYKKDEYGWSNKHARLFSDSLNQVLNGIKDGTISLDLLGNWKDATGKITNKPNNNSLSLFDEYGEVSSFLEPMVEILFNNRPIKPVFNPDAAFFNYFKGKRFAGNISDYSIADWNKLSRDEKIAYIQGIMPGFKDSITDNYDFEGSTFKTKDNYLQTISALNGNYSEENLSSIGIDLYSYLDPDAFFEKNGRSATNNNYTRSQSKKTEAAKKAVAAEIDRIKNTLKPISKENYATIYKDSRYHRIKDNSRPVSFAEGYTLILIGYAETSSGRKNYVFVDDEGNYYYLPEGNLYYDKLKTYISTNRITFNANGGTL